jgi:crotonobetainyl-CoA:carnitine CoA-transferase CaiB-like acyl-CoA transferase
VQPLAGTLVVDFSRLLPGPYATRELLRLGARVVRVEPPTGDPMRTLEPAWDAALNAGKESFVIDLKREPALANALVARADVVLDGFRPGVLERLGIELPESAVVCAITGFGVGNSHEQRAGHDLNYLGWAGALYDTAPALPPMQIADIAAGALGAVTQILAALLERARTGRGARIVVSMTHGSHELVAYRAGGRPGERMLTGDLACYRIYPTADGRHLTVGALEAKFFTRLCEVIGRPDLAPRHHDPDQEWLAAELAATFATRPLEEWLRMFDGEDVCAGPVATLDEGALEFGDTSHGAGPALGEHTERWRAELGSPS